MKFTNYFVTEEIDAGLIIVQEQALTIEPAKKTAGRRSSLIR